MSAALLHRPDGTFYIVTGSDEAAVQLAAADLAERLVPHAHSFAREIIDGATETVGHAVKVITSTIQALLTAPLLYENKLVWLKNASMLTDPVLGHSTVLSSALEELQNTLKSGISTGVFFLLSTPGADRRRSTYKSLTKLAKVIICDNPSSRWHISNADITEWIKKNAAKHHFCFEPAALDLFAIRVGESTSQAELELQKLFVSLSSEDGNTITEAVVRELVPATRASSIFDLSNAILTRNAPLCLEFLRQLILQGEHAIGILLVAIVPTIRNLLIVKALIERHDISPPTHANAFAHLIRKLPTSVVSHFPRKKDGTLNTYALGLSAIHSARYSQAELRTALKKCLETNRLLINPSPLEEATVLTHLLLRIVGKTATNTDYISSAYS
ncbi:DNA polymerase III subunit delta [Candidatus Xiphinematobacter sp. Idaho Grape]|uniref:DNA polymerase III subunit delta n=1 Tax=Candidatus Xiphinematobacter sp. Idaho Grape TaxID=1704307 RepID=UPI00070595A1|nr:DNA polymerase III subunit delta [Candidatus Xiphinematobacter sp. Idaho Grape]ALJ56780.1 DNA polymerase III subunit delta [Candidatus Xiphinematobacter sp. Idaho Grape]